MGLIVRGGVKYADFDENFERLLRSSEGSCRSLGLKDGR